MKDFFGDTLEDESEDNDVIEKPTKDEKIDLLATLLMLACKELLIQRVNLANIDIRLRIFYDKNIEKIEPAKAKVTDSYGKEKKTVALIDTDKMPFGKHKGKFMKDVPAQYLNWLKEQGCNNEVVSNYIDNNWDAIQEELGLD